MVLRLILDAEETGLADRLNVRVKKRNNYIQLERMYNRY